jgi:mannosyltransferase OCH1-like enzyme
MFEKNLFHVWYQGCENILDKRFILNKKAWKEMNPGWKYHCLGEQDIMAACRDYSEGCVQAITRTTNLHTKIDLGRLVVLYLNGGVNIDMDMYAFRPIEYSQSVLEMVNFANTGKHFIGVSVNPLNILEKIITHQSTRNVYKNAFLASSKGNPVLKDIINTYISNILTIKETGGGAMYVNKTTGPTMFSNTLHKGLVKYNDQNTLFEFDYAVFEPCDVTGNCRVNNDTVAIHNFELSWLSENLKFLVKFYITNKSLIYIASAILILYLIRFLY